MNMFKSYPKIRLTLMAVLLVALSLHKAGAQMKIGMPAGAANVAAILDISNTAGGNKGFLFPMVALTNTTTWALAGTATNGMAVFNTVVAGSGNTAVFAGLYIWNNGQWNQISTQSSISAASFTGSTLTCAGTQSGTYQVGTPMTSSNTKVVAITLATAGTYSATTTMVNGVSFSASGTALSTGATNFTLTASGVPAAGGTFPFPISFGGQNCTFSVVFAGNASSGGGAIISSTTCGSAIVTGTLTNGIAASGVTVSIPVLTNTPGNYVISTTAVNGIGWSGTGTLATGAGYIVLTASGTPNATGVISYPLSTSPGCSFSATNAVSSSSGGSAIVSAWNCTGTDAGTLQVGTAANGVTHTITATVTTVGTYSVTATTNGITYAGSGTFAGTGSQTITLTASGIPATQGSNSFTTSAAPTCSFIETVATAASFACGTVTTVQSPTGALVNGTVYTGSYTIAYASGNSSAYSTYSQTVNGLTLTRVAGNYAAGGGNVLYNLTGTASGAVPAVFTISECTSVTFGINPTSGGTGVVSAWNCTGTDAGTLQVGIAASGVSHAITATVTTVGTYSVTATTNGITYAGSGTFAGTGSRVITLTASGTPTNSGSNSFTTSAAPACNFTETVATAASFACGTATTVQSPTGDLVNGTTYTGSYTIPYTVGNGSAYSTYSQTVNGLTLTRVAGNYTAGSGNMVYNLTGNAGAAASATFTIQECTNVTFGFVSPTSGGTGIVSAWDCAGTDAGTLQVGVAASGVTHAITATVTTLGNYKVTATTNGVTYTSTGTFAGTGSQAITLTASGIPTTQGSNSFTSSATTACSFTKTVAPAATFACSGATTVQSPTGSLGNGTAYTGSYTIAYTAGNGTSYGITTQTVNGLTLKRVAGIFSSGGGNVVYNLTGNAGAAVSATFTIPECITAFFGSCTNDVSVGSGAIVQMMYDNTGGGTASYSWCARTVIGPDGLTWLDRNLGAYKVADSINDAASFGSLYEWGRNTDGHQRAASGRGVDVGFSATTPTLATTDTPGNVGFILSSAAVNYDWRSDNNDLRWNSFSGSGANLVQENNPCPSGYHVPTTAQIVAVGSGWANGTYAFSSTLRLPVAGTRTGNGGAQLTDFGSGYYWSATPNGIYAYFLNFKSDRINLSLYGGRASGYSIRCIKN